MHVSSSISWSWQVKEHIHWTLEIGSLHQNPGALPSCWSMNVTDFGILKQDSASGCPNPLKQECWISASFHPLYLTQFSLGLGFHSFITSAKAPSEESGDNHSSTDSRELRRQESPGAASAWGWLWLPKKSPQQPFGGGIGPGMGWDCSGISVTELTRSALAVLLLWNPALCPNSGSALTGCLLHPARVGDQLHRHLEI